MRFLPNQQAELHDFDQESASGKQKRCMYTKAGGGSSGAVLIQSSVSWCGGALSVKSSGQVKEKKH